jgi:hypothetical protein
VSPFGWLSVLGLLVYGFVRDRHWGVYIWIALGLIAIFAIPNMLARANALIFIDGEHVDYRGILRVRRPCRRDALVQGYRVRTAVLGTRIVLSRLLLVDRTEGPSAFDSKGVVA